jgi:hypothetical protein
VPLHICNASPSASPLCLKIIPRGRDPRPAGPPSVNRFPQPKSLDHIFERTGYFGAGRGGRPSATPSRNVRDDTTGTRERAGEIPRSGTRRARRAGASESTSKALRRKSTPKVQLSRSGGSTPHAHRTARHASGSDPPVAGLSGGSSDALRAQAFHRQRGRSRSHGLLRAVTAYNHAASVSCPSHNRHCCWRDVFRTCPETVPHAGVEVVLHSGETRIFTGHDACRPRTWFAQCPKAGSSQ